MCEVLATSLHFEKFEDLCSSAYRVTINKVQQSALKVAGGPVPLPSKQLALVAQKKGEEKRAYHGMQFVTLDSVSSQLRSFEI